MADHHRIQNVDLILAYEDSMELRWVGAEHLREQLLAAWMVVDPRDLPLNPRIVGKPGVGKTTLAYAVAKSLGRPVYIVQCTMDTRPEDLLVTPVLSGAGQIAYHASGLVTAMIKGGVCILDEGNRMSEKSWASLAPLLDNRRYAESIVAGIKIPAHPEFRVAVTMNDDASTYEIPEYILSRLQPQIEVGFPSRREEIEILKFNVPFAPDALVAYVADFLQKAHGQNLPFTSRDGVNIVRQAIKMGALKKSAPEGYLAEAIEAILGADGADFLATGEASGRMRGAMRRGDARRKPADDEDEDDESMEPGEGFEDLSDPDDPER